MKDFIQERDEAFASGSEKKIRAYCKKYGIDIPEDEEIFWAGVHKAICQLFLNIDSKITIQQYNKSYDWLIKHGYHPNIDGGEK